MSTVVPHPRVELERLYIEHGEQVRAICGSILRNRQEAEDAAQQVFVAAFRALRAGTVPRDGGAWLATIARRESWARVRRIPVTGLPEGVEDRAQEDPASTVVRRAELAETLETIAGLPASQREALLLREVRGLGYDELADGLRLSRASVRSLLNRARTTLRMQLERGAAVVTGAPWVNALARLFDSASSPAVPSATRAAAVGLGALAIAGGAVTGSTTPARHAHTRPAAHRGAISATARHPVSSGVDLNPERSPRQVQVSAGRTADGGNRGEDRGSGTRTSSRDSSGAGSSGEDTSSDVSVPTSSSSGGDGGRESSGGSGSSDTAVTSDSSADSTSSTSGRDGGGSSDGGSSDGGSSGSSGSSDGGSSDGGS